MGKQLFFLSLCFLSDLYSFAQNKYFLETDELIKQLVLDQKKQLEYNFKANVIMDPPLSSGSIDLINLELKQFDILSSKDSIFGIWNPFFKNDADKEAFTKAIKEYHFEPSNRQIKRYSAKDSERIFDQTNELQAELNKNQSKVLSSSEHDSLVIKSHAASWSKFKAEFGDCYVAYEIPVFNKAYNYCLFEWSYACSEKIGQGFRGLYQKVNGAWLARKLTVIWSN